MTARTTVLDARYGRTPDRRRRRTAVTIVVGAVLAAAAIAWALWTGIGGSVNALEVTTTSVTADDSATTVRWLVTGRAGTPVVCAIQAQDPSGVVVGLDEVSVPASGRANRSGTTVVRTVRPASTGLIASCRDA